MSPPSYNIAIDCIDKHAASWVNKHNTALLYLRADESGRLREPPLKLTYSSLQGLTNCFANALVALGLRKGERLVIALPNSAEFPRGYPRTLSASGTGRSARSGLRAADQGEISYPTFGGTARDTART